MCTLMFFLKAISCSLKLVSLYTKYYIITSKVVAKVFYLGAYSNLFMEIIGHPGTCLAFLESFLADLLLFEWHLQEKIVLKKLIINNPALSGEEIKQMIPEIKAQALERSAVTVAETWPIIISIVAFCILSVLGRGL